MADSMKSLKKRMATPPIPQPAPRDRSHRSRNDRNRIRMEISPDQCDVIVGMLSGRLRETPVDSPEFKSLYGVYWALRNQMNRVSARSQAGGQ